MHLTTRPTWKRLDNSPGCSFLRSLLHPPTMIRSDLFLPLRSPRLSGISYTSSPPAVSPPPSPPLALLIEDDLSEIKGLNEQYSQLTSYQRRFIDLSEKGRDIMVHTFELSHYGYPPVQHDRFLLLRRPSLPRPVRRLPNGLSGAYSIVLGLPATCPLTLRPFISR